MQSDPGYAAYAELRWARRGFSILLFGVHVHDVITADEEEGVVVKCLRDPISGRYIVDHSTGIGLQFKLRGPVQILVK
ncbi:hypothetical protein [Rhizobium sp. L51/94]|uniref:hypothetical protein n=1 Tax=Rhizobium sp. L51/94 TaxID=2819999 RepID=UPI001C5ACDEF|nr:hypothetical protein [Rhizobium sp. L51/94]QXZ79661.1 hypothetical protein J5274_06675 [Rhizobium sp. L51/94]